MGISAAALAAQVQVNLPFAFLELGYLERFLQRGLNPELGLDAYSLGHYPPAVFRGAARAFHGAGRRITLHGPFQDLGYEARHYRWDQERWLARSAATWKELAALAAPHGVTVMLENVHETEPELFLEVLGRVGAPNLQVCFDVGHLLAFSTGDFPHWLETLAPVIGHLHLHDNHGDHDSHLALGAGRVPLQETLDYLADHGRRPLITLEPHQEGGLDASLDYLAGIWPWD
jgi:sugar phosphate isomerase/epimerase